MNFYLKDFLQENNTFFDLILIIDVIEHIKDYLGFLEAMREKARVKIFHILIEITVLRVLLSSPIMWRRLKFEHIHYFTKEVALASLEDTGYKIVDYFYTTFSFDLPAELFIYALGEFPLKLISALNQDMAVRKLGGHSLIVLAK